MQDYRRTLQKLRAKHIKIAKLNISLFNLGIILFILVAFLFTFKDQIFSQLFSKKSSSAAAAEEWHQLQHDPQHTGSTAVSVPPDYEVAWAWMDKTHIVKNFVSALDKSLTDGFESGYKQNVIFSSQVQPIIADGKAYFGAMNGTFYAVDALTGDNRWDFTSQGPILNTAAYDQGVVVFASMDSKVYGINSVDGTKRWEYQTGAGINAAPIIANSTAYIGSRDGKFYALDVLTGNKKWEYTTRVNPADSNSPFNKAPIVMSAAISEDGSTVFFGAENMYFYALNTSDGSEKWVSQKLIGQSFLYSWPVVKGDKVIVRTMSSAIGAEQDRDSSSPPIETVLDGLSADPTVAEEKTAIFNWLQNNPTQKTMYVFNTADGTEPYQLAMGRVTGENKTAHPPAVDQSGQVLTYWRSKMATVFRNPAIFGTKYCSDISGLDLSNGDRLKIALPLPESARLACPEIDNGFQLTVGGDYLYLFQPFRGAKVINLKTGSNRGISLVVAKGDCGTFRGSSFDGSFGSQIIYYGNDSGTFTTNCGGEVPGDTRPPFAYKNAWGYSGIAVASVNNTPMLFLNETGSYAIVALRQKGTGTTTPAPSASPTPAPSASQTTLTLQVASSGDDVHETDLALRTDSSTVRLGGCGSPTICIAGLRFTNVTLPKDATIVSARLQVTPSQADQWVQLDYIINGENAGNSAVFSASAKPSQRALTTASVSHSDSVQWPGTTPVNLDEMKSVIQEVVNRIDWVSGNSISVFVKATIPVGFGAKFIHSFDGSAVNAAKLIITYQ